MTLGGAMLPDKPKVEKEKRSGTYMFRPQVMMIIFSLFIIAIGCLCAVVFLEENGVRDAIVGVMGVSVGGLVVTAGNLIRET